jgi:hypothetical protein
MIPAILSLVALPVPEGGMTFPLLAFALITVVLLHRLLSRQKSDVVTRRK